LSLFGFLFLRNLDTFHLDLLPQGEKELFSVSMKGLPYTISVKLGRRKTDFERERIVKIFILSLDGRGQR
jgi:hypothetical protein